MILQEISAYGPSEPVRRGEVPPGIQQKAQLIGQGVIIDITNMEGSGGGDYPAYVVFNGIATLLMNDFGNGGAHDIFELTEEWEETGMIESMPFLRLYHPVYYP